MEKNILLFISLVCLFSCTDKVEKQANEYYVLAEQAYSKGAYEVAREKIDSIRLLFPKAFKTRRAALDLRLKVDLAEGQQAVEDADKIIMQKTDLVERMKSKMVLEPIKGTVGNYVSPNQTVDKLDRNMVRAQLDEHGLLSLTAIHCGKIGYRAIRVECEGQSIQTPSSSAQFTSMCKGKELEEVVFSNDREVGVSAFLSQHVGKDIKLTFIGGDRSETVLLSPADVKAVSDVYDLYLQMKTLNDARVRYADACEKIKFIHRKMDGEGGEQAEND
ncbi:MAG: hypothetical protein Q4D12_07725 [Bacteroidales bacterium]|nr:hypothetical protein [Bacteroidales bacterium]